MDSCQVCHELFKPKSGPRQREWHRKTCSTYNKHLMKKDKSWHCQICSAKFSIQLLAFVHMKKTHFNFKNELKPLEPMVGTIKDSLIIVQDQEPIKSKILKTEEKTLRTRKPTKIEPSKPKEEEPLVRNIKTKTLRTRKLSKTEPQKKSVTTVKSVIKTEENPKLRNHKPFMVERRKSARKISLNLAKFVPEKKTSKDHPKCQIVLKRISNEIIQSYQMETLPTFSLQDVFDDDIDDSGIFEVNNEENHDFDLEIKMFEF